MSRHEIGVDLVDIDRIISVLDRFPNRFRERVLTEAEARYCGNKVDRIAGRWAAKEAISKVLGLGVRGVGWREIEILPNWAGAPQVRLHAAHIAGTPCLFIARRHFAAQVADHANLAIVIGQARE